MLRRIATWLMIQSVDYTSGADVHGFVLVFPDKLICFACLPPVKAPDGRDLSGPLGLAGGKASLAIPLSSKKTSICEALFGLAKRGA